MSRTLSNDAYAAPPVASHSLTYQVNGLNQYTAASNRTYTYDANGNLTSDGTTTYTYDVENRLVGASRATPPTSSTTATRCAEYNNSGALLRRYVHGPDADEPVAVCDGAALGLSVRRYTLTDERGPVAALAGLPTPPRH